MTVKWPRNRTEGPQGSSRTYFKSRNQPDARPCVSGAPVAAEGWDGLLKKKKWKIASHFQRTVLRCDRQVAQELNRGASRVIPDLLQVKQPTRRRQIPVFACLTPPWRPKARFLPETLQFPRWTVPNNHSQFHAYASSPDEHFNGYSDTDSDDGSVYDGLPDLMDPDDEPTTDMFHSIDYFKYYFLYPLPPTPLYE